MGRRWMWNADAPLLVSPNPALDELHLQNITDEQQSIKIISLSGKAIKSLKLTPLESQILGIYELPSGAYTIRIENGRKVKFQRFIKN